MDLTRRAINSPRGTMVFLIVKSFEILLEENVDKVYIGWSPFHFYIKNNSLIHPFTNSIFFRLILISVIFWLFFDQMFPSIWKNCVIYRKKYP